MLSGTSHNMPAPELVELCDEMGFMMMIEPFDEWDIAKSTTVITVISTNGQNAI